MKEFLGYLLGNASPALAAASLGFSCFAAFVMYKVRINKRDVNSPRTPLNWDWNFFWKDTWPRMTTTFVIILLALRLMFFWKVNPGLAIALAIIIGFIGDGFGKIFEKASSVSTEIINEKIDEAANKLKSAQIDLKEAKKANNESPNV